MCKDVYILPKKMETTTIEKPLQHISIMLSASVPDDSLRAQELYGAVTVIARRIFAAGGGIVFGGHPSITPLIRRAASDVERENDAIRLYQLRRFEQDAPQDIWDIRVFPHIYWVGSQSKDDPIEPDLTKMRKAMIDATHAAIFIGGRTSGFYGKKPGIRDEYERFLRKHPQGPLYLIGLMQGEVAKIIAEVEQKTQKEPNGLSDEERQLVHHDDTIELIAPIVVADIGKVVKK